jgi:hypothetical protein
MGREFAFWIGAGKRSIKAVIICRTVQNGKLRLGSPMWHWKAYEVLGTHWAFIESVKCTGSRSGGPTTYIRTKY